MTRHKYAILPLFGILLLFPALQTAHVIHVAPMQGYTNRFLRSFYRFLSPSVVVWTEMEKLEDLLASDASCIRRLSHDAEAEHPCVLQLGGNCPQDLSTVVARATQEQYNYHEFNLNVGCPSVETGGSANFGAALMLQPERCRQLVAAAKAASGGKPVSIKCRIGAHDMVGPDGILPVDTYAALFAFVQEVTQDGNVDHVVVHARAAILSGLSPTKNRHIPPLRHDFVHQLAADFPSLRITLNGGIRSVSELKMHREACTCSGVEGLMMGRWLLQRPLDLCGIDQQMQPALVDMKDSRTLRCAGPGPGPSPGPGPGPGPDPASGSALMYTASDPHHRRIQGIHQYALYGQRHVNQGVYPLSQIMLPLLLAAEQVRDDCAAVYEEPQPGSPPQVGSPLDPEEHPTRDQLWELYDSIWEATRIIGGSTSKGRASTFSSSSTSSHIKGDTEHAPSFRKLTAALSEGMGKKVLGKVVRNRSEV